MMGFRALDFLAILDKTSQALNGLMGIRFEYGFANKKGLLIPHFSLLLINRSIHCFKSSVISTGTGDLLPGIITKSNLSNNDFFIIGETLQNVLISSCCRTWSWNVLRYFHALCFASPSFVKEKKSHKSYFCQLFVCEFVSRIFEFFLSFYKPFFKLQFHLHHVSSDWDCIFAHHLFVFHELQSSIAYIFIPICFVQGDHISRSYT